jgi:AraC-like DNA-binding protein
MTAAAEPLARHRMMQTADAEEAQQTVADVYVAHRLRTSAPLDARLNVTRGDRMTFGYLTYGALASLEVPPLLDCYHVNLTLRGHTRVRHGTRTFATDGGRAGVVLSTTEESTVTWSPDAAQFAVKIPRLAMEAQLSALLQDAVTTPLRFRLGFSLTTSSGSSLLASARFLADQLDVMPAGGMRLLREELESYVLTHLLLDVPNTYSTRLRVRSRTAERHAVETAVAYIEAHPERALGDAELAAVTGIGGAALRSAFRAELDMPPAEYVRETRLARAHDDLRAGGRGDVADVARRWGFADLDAFADRFAKRYGIRPAES